ncbi:MAG: tetratricopeptide repeat protein [Fulvivirga sp.]
MKKILISILFTLICFTGFAQGDKLEKAKLLLDVDSAQSALAVLEPTSQFDIGQQPEALSLIGKAYLKSKNDSSAMLAFQKCLEISKSINDIEYEIESLYWLTRLSAITGKFERAVTFGEDGSLLARLHQNNVMEFRINNFLSWAYFMTNKDFDKVLIHEQRQLELVSKVGNDMQKAQVYNNLGYDLTIAGIVHLDSTISLMTWANDQYGKTENNKGRWYTLMNLTWQHRLKGDHQQAIEFGKLSLKQAQKEEDRHAIIEASFQLGESLMALGQLEEAKKFYDIGYKQSIIQEDRDKYVFDVYYANYLFKLGELDKAIVLLEETVEFLTTSEVFYEMHGRALLSLLYVKAGKPTLAQAQLDIIESPRHNYIAMETKCIAAIAAARLAGYSDKTKALLANWKKRAQEIGASQIADWLDQELKTNSQ